MRSLFNYAVSKNYVDKKNNPILPKEKSVVMSKIKPYCLPQEEVKAIFDTKFYLPLLLGLRCGLRFGLTVEDVDLH